MGYYVFFFQCPFFFASIIPRITTGDGFCSGFTQISPTYTRDNPGGIRDLRSAGLVMMILQVVYVDPKVSRLLPAIPND